MVVIKFLHQNKNKTLDNIFQDITNYNTNSFSMFEFKKWLRKNGINLSTPEQKQLIEYYDINNNGSVDVYEFFQGITPYLMEDQDYKSKNEFRNKNSTRSFEVIMDILARDISIFMDINKLNYYELYLMVDKNGDGIINFKELRNWLKRNINVKMNKQELNQIIKHFDKNNDKKITVPEFHNTIKTLLKNKNKISTKGLSPDVRTINP